ncbi:MAG: hypothetical protein R2690_19290 [Acidimicrobiales bacterium]
MEAVLFERSQPIVQVLTADPAWQVEFSDSEVLLRRGAAPDGPASPRPAPPGSAVPLRRGPGPGPSNDLAERVAAASMGEEGPGGPFDILRSLAVDESGNARNSTIGLDGVSGSGSDDGARRAIHLRGRGAREERHSRHADESDEGDEQCVLDEVRTIVT